MGGYVINFTVYTMAMIGLICFAVFVYKKITDGAFRSRNTKYLSVEETMSLTPRKTLHVVRAGNEKFLIASDVDRTTLIAKLADDKARKVKASEEVANTPVAEVIKEDTVAVKDEPVRETAGLDINPVDNKVVHLEPINATKKKVAINSGTKVQRRRTMPEKQTSETDYSKPKGFSPIKEMAKRINEL